MEYLSQEEKKIKREQIKKQWLRESVLSYRSVSSVEGLDVMYKVQSELRRWRERELRRYVV